MYMEVLIEFIGVGRKLVLRGRDAIAKLNEEIEKLEKESSDFSKVIVHMGGITKPFPMSRRKLDLLRCLALAVETGSTKLFNSLIS